MCCGSGLHSGVVAIRSLLAPQAHRPVLPAAVLSVVALAAPCHDTLLCLAQTPVDNSTREDAATSSGGTVGFGGSSEDDVAAHAAGALAGACVYAVLGLALRRVPMRLPLMHV